MKRSIHDYALALYESVVEQPNQRAMIVQRFVDQLALDKNRQLLPLIIVDLGRVEGELSKTLLVEVTTAQALTDLQRVDIQNLLKEKYPDTNSVELVAHTDSLILGGIKLKIADQVIDHTVKNKLAQLAARL